MAERPAPVPATPDVTLPEKVRSGFQYVVVLRRKNVPVRVLDRDVFVPSQSHPVPVTFTPTVLPTRTAWTTKSFFSWGDILCSASRTSFANHHD